MVHEFITLDLEIWNMFLIRRFDKNNKEKYHFRKTETDFENHPIQSHCEQIFSKIVTIKLQNLLNSELWASASTGLKLKKTKSYFGAFKKFYHKELFRSIAEKCMH